MSIIAGCCVTLSFLIHYGMNRRSFIKVSSTAGLAIAGFPAAPALLANHRQNEDAAGPADFELNETTIADLQDMMQSEQFTAYAITGKYLERIRTVDQSGLTLNAVMELNPDALAIAAELDRERAAGKVRGPLHGIPVLIKDNIDTGDRMQTTAGALALEGNIAAKDAFIVNKLRDAGAIILGKTNLSEWANFRSEKSTSGWSSRGGQTKNPYILDRNPLGSSSGSGAGVAANLCTVAVGTETDGSIVCPASVCALVGIKPTVGLVSRSGIIPISCTQDTAGPMARTVTDAAILLGALAGADEADPVTLESRGKAYDDYTRFLDPEGLSGRRIGIDRKWKSSMEAVNALFGQALDRMREKGAAIIEVDYSEHVNELQKSEFLLMKFEFKDGVNRYLSRSNAQVKSLKDVIEFNRANASKTMPFFGQDILEAAEALGGPDSPEYLQAVRTTTGGSRNLMINLLKENRLDAVTGITMSPAACTDLLYGDRYGDSYAGMAAAVAGFPHITVPCGQVMGLPVGISFFAGPYSEPDLLRIAYAFEQATKLRTRPQFIPALNG